MRLVDADKLKERIRLSTLHWSDLWKRVVGDIIDNQDTIEILQWISCSERLPEEYKVEFLTAHERDYTKSDKVYVTYIYGNHRYCGMDFTMDGEWMGNNEVIAWMPFPQPYKKGE